MGSYKKAIRNDLDTLRKDVSNLADDLTGFLSDRGDEVAGDMKQSVQQIRDDIGEANSQTADKSRAYARERLDGFGEMIETSVHEHPFTMLAIAAGLGAILAAQLRR